MKKITLLLMAISIFITPCFAAQTFSDLPEGHWAKGVVEEMVEAKIISGFTDGTFRPKEDLTKIQSLILLSKIAGVNTYATEANNFLTTYTTALSPYTTSYKKEVAYLLGVKVLYESDLENYLSATKINTGISREEMAILVTRVMGKETEVKNKSIVILPFTDTETISSTARPYVSYVYSEKIMTGLDATNFSPKTTISRAQAAAILQRIYKKVTIKPESATTPVTPTNPDTKPANSFLTGTITKIDTSASSVWIKDSAGTNEEYEYDEKTEFLVSTKKATSSAMAKSAEVTITISDDAYITIMNITNGANVNTETVKGTISSFNVTKKTITVLVGTKAATYSYSSTAKFTLDGTSKTAANALKKSYEITLELEENIAETVKVVTPDTSIIGKIIEADDDEGYIIIEDDKGKEYIIMDDEIDEYSENDEDYYLDDETKFYFEKSTKTYKAAATTSYLYKEDYYVKISFTKDYIDECIISAKKTTLTSSTSATEIIGEITKADYDEGYIVVDDGDDEYIIMDEFADEYTDDDEDYYLDDETEFYLEGTSKTYKNIATTSYLYKKGKYVKLTLNKDYITECRIAAKKTTLTSSSSSSSDDELIGEITKVDYNDGYIKFKDEDGDIYIVMDDEADEYDDGDEDLYFDAKTEFLFEGKTKKYSDLATTSYIYKKGYYIKATLDDDYIEKLEISDEDDYFDDDKSSSSSNTGNISDGYIHGYIDDFDSKEIVIVTDDDDEYTFKITSDCIIVNRTDSDPSDDCYYYDDDYEDELDEDDEVIVFLQSKSGTTYKTSLIVLL